MAQIEWTAFARQRLREAHEFIALDSALHADKFVAGIIYQVELLANQPFIGRKMPEFPNLPYRELIYGDYRILYLPGKDVVQIRAITHGRREIWAEMRRAGILPAPR